MYDVIVRAIVQQHTVTLGYVKPNQVLTVRLFKPYAVEKCKNGNTIVRGMCPHDGIPKSLTLDSITFAKIGDCMGGAVRALYNAAAVTT